MDNAQSPSQRRQQARTQRNRNNFPTERVEQIQRPLDSISNQGQKKMFDVTRKTPALIISASPAGTPVGHENFLKALLSPRTAQRESYIQMLKIIVKEPNTSANALSKLRAFKKSSPFSSGSDILDQTLRVNIRPTAWALHRDRSISSNDFPLAVFSVYPHADIQDCVITVVHNFISGLKFLSGPEKNTPPLRFARRLHALKNPHNTFFLAPGYFYETSENMVHVWWLEFESISVAVLEQKYRQKKPFSEIEKYAWNQYVEKQELQTEVPYIPNEFDVPSNSPQDITAIIVFSFSGYIVLPRPDQVFLTQSRLKSRFSSPGQFECERLSPLWASAIEEVEQAFVDVEQSLNNSPKTIESALQKFDTILEKKYKMANETFKKSSFEPYCKDIQSRNREPIFVRLPHQQNCWNLQDTANSTTIPFSPGYRWLGQNDFGALFLEMEFSCLAALVFAFLESQNQTNSPAIPRAVLGQLIYLLKHYGVSARILDEAYGRMSKQPVSQIMKLAIEQIEQEKSFPNYYVYKNLLSLLEDFSRSGILDTQKMNDLLRMEFF